MLPAHQALRRQRARPRPGGISPRTLPPSGRRRSSRSSCGTTACRCSTGALAHVVCRVVDIHPAGDHVLWIGEVEHLHHRDGEPLLFYTGRFGTLREVARALRALSGGSVAEAIHTRHGASRRTARCGGPQVSARSRDRSGPNTSRPASQLTGEFQQRDDRPRARDPQQLGRDAQRGRALRGRANRLEILLVRAGSRIPGRASPSAGTGGSCSMLARISLDPGLERALDRHAFGAGVDSHGQRRQQHRHRPRAVGARSAPTRSVPSRRIAQPFREGVYAAGLTILLQLQLTDFVQTGISPRHAEPGVQLTHPERVENGRSSR